VTKKFQNKTIDTSALAVPERVSVAMADVAEDMREGLLARAGLQVMAALMDADVSAPRSAREARSGANRGAPRHRGRLGDPGRAQGGGDPAAGARRGRLRGAAGAVV